MEITLDLLLKGKPTIIKGREFLSTKDYVEGFIQEMSKFTKKFIVNVSLPTQLTLTNKEEDITFNKVWIQAVIPGSGEMREVINLVYALDIKKPCYKVFRTYTIDECHFVFNKEWNKDYLIEDDAPFKFPIKELMEKPSDIASVIAKMKSTFISDDCRHDYVGKLFEKCLLLEEDSLSGKVKLSPNIVIKAYENIYLNSTSKLYKKDQEATVYEFFIALLDQVREGYKKDISNVFEKTYLVNNLIQYGSN